MYIRKSNKNDKFAYEHSASTAALADFGTRGVIVACDKSDKDIVGYLHASLVPTKHSAGLLKVNTVVVAKQDMDKGYALVEACVKSNPHRNIVTSGISKVFGQTLVKLGFKAVHNTDFMIRMASSKVMKTAAYERPFVVSAACDVDEVGEFWVVTKAFSPDWTLIDVLFKSDVCGMQNQFLGGLLKTDILGLFDIAHKKEAEAFAKKAIAEQFINNLPDKIGSKKIWAAVMKTAGSVVTSTIDETLPKEEIGYSSRYWDLVLFGAALYCAVRNNDLVQAQIHAGKIRNYLIEANAGILKTEDTFEACYIKSPDIINSAIKTWENMPADAEHEIVGIAEEINIALLRGDWEYAINCLNQVNVVEDVTTDKEKMVLTTANTKTANSLVPDVDKLPQEQREVGIKIEQEHAKTYENFMEALQNGEKPTMNDFAESIANDHINENEFYYDPYLVDMEAAAKNDKKEGNTPWTEGHYSFEPPKDVKEGAEEEPEKAMAGKKTAHSEADIADTIAEAQGRKLFDEDTTDAEKRKLAIEFLDVIEEEGGSMTAVGSKKTAATTAMPSNSLPHHQGLAKGASLGFRTVADNFSVTPQEERELVAYTELLDEPVAEEVVVIDAEDDITRGLNPDAAYLVEPTIPEVKIPELFPQDLRRLEDEQPAVTAFTNEQNVEKVINKEDPAHQEKPIPKNNFERKQIDDAEPKQGTQMEQLREKQKKNSPYGARPQNQSTESFNNGTTHHGSI